MSNSSVKKASQASVNSTSSLIDYYAPNWRNPSTPYVSSSALAIYHGRQYSNRFYSLDDPDGLVMGSKVPSTYDPDWLEREVNDPSKQYSTHYLNQGNLQKIDKKHYYVKPYGKRKMINRGVRISPKDPNERQEYRRRKVLQRINEELYMKAYPQEYAKRRTTHRLLKNQRIAKNTYIKQVKAYQEEQLKAYQEEERIKDFKRRMMY